MNKKTSLFILSFIILNLLSSCTKEEEIVKKSWWIDFAEYAKKTDNKLDKSPIIKKEKTVEEINETTSESAKELTIDERCIWCGKCAMIAPTNFAMDYNTLKAVVISQKNMFSQEVSTSVQVCPTDSIHII